MAQWDLAQITLNLYVIFGFLYCSQLRSYQLLMGPSEADSCQVPRAFSSHPKAKSGATAWKSDSRRAVGWKLLGFKNQQRVMGCSLRSLFLEQLKGEALLLIAALGCAVQNSFSLCCAVWCPVLLSVSLGSFGLDISAFSLRGPYHKPQLSSLGSQMFVPLGTMPISFVLLLVGLAMS